MRSEVGSQRADIRYVLCLKSLHMVIITIYGGYLCIDTNQKK